MSRVFFSGLPFSTLITEKEEGSTVAPIASTVAALLTTYSYTTNTVVAFQTVLAMTFLSVEVDGLPFIRLGIEKNKNNGDYKTVRCFGRPKIL